jgi:hypothetical protein
MVLGPSTPLSSSRFDYGADLISGSQVTDEQAVLRNERYLFLDLLDLPGAVCDWRLLCLVPYFRHPDGDSILAIGLARKNSAYGPYKGRVVRQEATWCS